MNIILWIILSAVAAFIIYLIITSFIISQKVLYPNKCPIERINKIHTDQNVIDFKWYESLKKEDLSFKSKFGYNIRAFIVYNPKPTQNVIIQSHGVTMRSEFSLRYIHILLNMGYNVLFVDSRSHGETGGKDVSFGYYEKHDLAQIIKWAKEHYSGKVGLHGESMGAGVSMQAVGLESVDFLIDDCGYSGFDEELKHRLRETFYLIEPINYPLTRLFIKLRSKFDVNDVSGIKALANTDFPVLVIHGSDDDYVPYYMANLVLESIPHEKKHLYAPKTVHAGALTHDTKEYENQVKAFLSKYELYFGE